MGDSGQRVERGTARGGGSVVVQLLSQRHQSPRLADVADGADGSEPDRKIRSDDAADELIAGPGSPEAAERTNGSLSLIGRREIRNNNSWMHNYHRLVKGRDRCTLLMHPDDARPRGLVAGQRVHVRSRVGAVEVALEVTEDIRAGVVSLPHGWGHDREGTRLGVANTVPGASANDLTDDLLVDALCGTARLNGVPVEVTG